MFGIQAPGTQSRMDVPFSNLHQLWRAVQHLPVAFSIASTSSNVGHRMPELAHGKEDIICTLFCNNKTTPITSWNTRMSLNLELCLPNKVSFGFWLRVWSLSWRTVTIHLLFGSKLILSKSQHNQDHTLRDEKVNIRVFFQNLLGVLLKKNCWIHTGVQHRTQYNLTIYI